MTNDVTPEAVYEAHLREPEFAEMPAEMLDVLRDYILQLPELLESDLDEPCTVGTLMSAKFKFVKYCLENDFVQRAAEATPDEALGFMTRTGLVGMMTEVLGELVSQLESILGDVDAFLVGNGLTDAEVMLSDKVGLNGEARKLYENGELTIGQLLLVQPSVITKNT